MKKYLFALILVVPFLFISPAKAFASNFAGVNVTINKANGTMVNGVRVDLSSNTSDTYTGSGSTRQCKTGVDPAGAFVNLNFSPDSYYSRISGASTGGTYTYSGQSYNNPDGTLYFGNGVNSTSNGGGMGFGFACSCNPFIVTIYVPSGWFLDIDQSGSLSPGDIEGPTSWNDSVSGTNDVRTNLNYRMEQYTTDKHSIKATVGTLSISGGVLTANGTITHNRYTGENDSRLNAQWIWQQSQDNVNWSAPVTTGWTTYTEPTNDQTYNYSHRIYPRTDTKTPRLDSNNNPSPVPITIASGYYYKVYLEVCDPGYHSQADCPWTDGTESLMHIKNLHENSSTVGPSSFNSVLVATAWKSKGSGTTAVDHTCTINRTGYTEPLKSQTPVTITATANGFTPGSWLRYIGFQRASAPTVLGSTINPYTYTFKDLGDYELAVTNSANSNEIIHCVDATITPASSGSQQEVAP